MSTARRRASRRISAAAAVPAKTEDYAIRWQPITSTYTPSADIMSSPDPLNETADESAFFPPSSRRVARSQLSSRFGSRSVSRSVSPRKQTFELEVGDNSSPQKLLVTVETDDAEPQSVNTRRKLFQSPASIASSRVRTRATTTTVPLRDEDEPTTPRRRGRPRKSNGTPIPGAGVKRRAATPMKRTPRRQRSSKASDTEDALSEVGAATPRSTRRGRPPKNRPVEPQSDAIAVPSSAATVSTARGGRRRRQAMDQDELIHMADMAAGTASFQDDEMLPIDDEVDLVMAPRQSVEGLIEELPPPSPQSSARGSDIWLGAAPEEELTPRPRRRSTRSKSKSVSATPAQPRRTGSRSAATSASQSTPRQPASQRLLGPEPEGQEPQAEDLDFPDLVAARSDVSSVDEQGPAEATAYRNDTIAQGEDFSMIFMDSIPSLQASFRMSNSGPPPSVDPGQLELGDETNLIINNTLESIRQEQEADEDDPAEDEQDPLDDVPMVDTEEAEPSGAKDPRHLEPEAELQDRVSSSPLRDGTQAIAVLHPQSPSPEVEEAPASNEAQSEPQPSEGLSPIRAFSASLARSPRKFASPLRHQVLKFTARQAEQVDPSPAEQEAEESVNISQRHDSNLAADDQSNMYEDSFSEIPQEVLAAATPRRPNAFASMPEQASDAEEGGEEEGEEKEEEEEEEEEEEQFEEPEATGALPVDEDMLDDVDLVGGTVQQEAIPQIHIDAIEEAREMPILVEPTVASSVSVASQPETGRLPTPDDTPPHNESEPDDEAAEKSASASRVSSAQPSPMPQTYEEIETVTYTASHRAFGQQPALSIEQPGLAPKVTPINQLSSPVQDNQSLMPEIPHMRSARPTLSPIVRAGRVLQSVTSDPPSPEGRERHLGSPFRSSASKDSKDSRTSRRISMSPPRPFNIPAPRSSSVGAAPGPEDPFRSSSKPIAQSSFLQALSRSIGGGAGHRRTISQESIGSSTRHAPPSEAMSWVANEGPISPRLRGDNTLQDVAQSSLVGPPREKAPEILAQVDGPAEQAEEPGSEPGDQGEEEADDEPAAQKDDETDIWEFEASRTTPRSTRQQPFGRKAPAPILRRGTIPSPWVRPGDSSFARAQREASPELHTDGHDRTAPSSVLPGSEPDEFSLLAEQRREEEERARANQSPSKGGKFDLSSFFSSPAALPGMLAAKTMSLLGSRPPADRTVEMEEVPESPIPATTVAPAAQATVESISSEESEAEPSPAQKAPSILPTQNLYPKVPQKLFEPSSSPRRDLFSPVRPAQGEVTPEQALSKSPEAAEEITMPVVAQKQNFTPRPRQASQSLFQPSSAAQPQQQQPPPQEPPLPSSAVASGARTPPRMQLSHEDIANWRQQTTNAGSDDSPGFRRPLLRPLPHKNASPTKSSLRSPLKPHTPGRVVEFTSSVLSPMEQAQVRQQVRSSILGSSLFGHPPQPPQQSQPETRNDKENEDQASLQHQQEPSDVSMTDASPLPKSPVPPPLSETVWTREHWLLLDELLQLRRQGPFHGDYEHSVKSEKLVGKTVRSQGEAMKLERWHMDCVDAFRMEVGEGWDEGVLAKRLFALVLGEKRRARGVHDKQTRVMFH